MKLILTLVVIITFSLEPNLAQSFNSQQLYDSYGKYRANEIENKRFKHTDLIKKINELKEGNVFNVELAGKSLEEREIYLLSIGKGKTNVLLWSQMHGDESTATMALLDIFNFFSTDDEFNKLRDQILGKVKIYFIPMLNPDGAEKFKRRNALDIDLNRDALRVQSPESKILKTVRDSLKPKFGFNLHDQNTRYSSGNSYRSATISFLAPAFNYKKDINLVRGNTMKLIADLYLELQKFIPGHIAKYNDDFEPRAFGDNFIKWGTSSVLIESGGWKNDEEKQFIRKLNFIAILTGLNSIATGNYKKADINIYESIPFNDNLIFDVLLRNLTLNYEGNKFIIDVGINKEEINTKDFSKAYFEGKINDWGDLSIFYGYLDLDLTGCEIRESNIYNAVNLDKIDYQQLLKDGYGFVHLDSLDKNIEYSEIPLNVIVGSAEVDLLPSYQKYANFTIYKNNKLLYNIVNGCIFDITAEITKKQNGLIFR